MIGLVLQLCSVALCFLAMVGTAWLFSLVFWWVRTNGGPHG
jgi:hypothetical protein